jgi:hypothetical protein
MTEPITYTSDQLGDLYAQQVQDSEQVARWMGRALVAEFKVEALMDAIQMTLKGEYSEGQRVMMITDAEWLTLCQEALAAKTREEMK